MLQPVGLRAVQNLGAAILAISFGGSGPGPAMDGAAVDAGDVCRKRGAEVIHQKPRDVLGRLGDRASVRGARATCLCRTALRRGGGGVDADGSPVL
jgi:hypothetical protein